MIWDGMKKGKTRLSLAREIFSIRLILSLEAIRVKDK